MPPSGTRRQRAGLPDRCAAGSGELQRKEVETSNMIHCHAPGSAELLASMGLD
jgi:hypothetical protein